MQKNVSRPPRFSPLATGAAMLTLGLGVACGPQADSAPDARQLTDAPVGGTDAPVAIADASTTDGSTGSPDGAVVSPDAMIVPPDAAAPILGHLLLSEVVVTPTSGEYVEIYNPTSVAVDLSNYYLSDDQEYAMLPGLNGATAAPTINNSDFIVQFPAGSSIAAGQAITVAVQGSGFITTFAVDPTYSISLNAGSATPMIAILGDLAPTLTNSGESIVLFSWDGMSDLVQDIDCLNVGSPSAGNSLISKTGLSVDGPDADDIASTYLDDALTIPANLASPQSLPNAPYESTKRVLLEAMNEVETGGNGIIGHDETSENIGVTWDSTFTPPTPNVSDIVAP